MLLSTFLFGLLSAAALSAASEIRPRIVQARPGVPVGSMVASGEVELGFQQLSELLPLAGIDVLGTLPEPIAFITVFSGGVCQASGAPDPAREALEFMASPQVAEMKRSLVTVGIAAVGAMAVSLSAGNIFAGKLMARFSTPAMMLGDRCADFVLGLDEDDLIAALLL